MLNIAVCCCQVKCCVKHCSVVLVAGVYRWTARQSRHRSGTQPDRSATGPSPARQLTVFLFRYHYVCE